MKNTKRIVSLILAALCVLTMSVVSFAATATEEEPNDTMQTANSATIGTTYSGSISTEDKDYFSFSNSEAAQVQITFTYTNSDYIVSVYDKNGNLQNSKSTVSTSSSIKSDVISIVASDKYYVLVEAGYDCAESDTYKFVIDKVTDNTVETEDNGSFDTADSTTVKVTSGEWGISETYKGSLTKNDEDYWKISCPLDGYFFINFIKCDSACDLDVEVYDRIDVKSTPEVIGSVDVTKSELTSDGEVDSPTLYIGKGDYYLLVKGADGATGSYSFNIYFRQNSETEREYNNTKNTANAYEVGNICYGNIATESDVDMFKITFATSGSYFDLKLAALDDDHTGIWKVTILDSDSVVVETLQFDNKNATSYTFDDKSGTYYVKVEKGSTYTDNGYVISSTTHDAPEEDQSLVDWIKSLAWKDFWSQFQTLLDNLSLGSMVKTMFTSIVKVLMGIIGQ